ncbi:MAG TPA: hypothetical protein VKT32_05935 [Chthonomonadaceae bacterium]|nr:hypothetical protein [Chthonomonadaceae bacterium]
MANPVSGGGSGLSGLPRSTQSVIAVIAVLVILAVAGFLFWPRSADPMHLQAKVKQQKADKNK